MLNANNKKQQTKYWWIAG